MVVDPDKPSREEYFASKILGPLIIGVFTLVLLIGIAALVPRGYSGVYPGDTQQTDMRLSDAAQ